MKHRGTFSNFESALLEADMNPSLLELIEWNSKFALDFTEVCQQLIKVNITFVSEYTLQSVVEPLRYFCRLSGIEPAIVMAPPYQIEHNLITFGTDLPDSAKKVCVVIFDLEKMCAQHSTAPTPAQRDAFQALIEQRLRLCEECADRTGATLIVSSLFHLYPGLTQTFSASDVFSRHRFVEEANHFLQQLCEQGDLQFLPVHHAFNTYGTARCLSLRDYLASDIPFSPEGANRISAMLARNLAALFGRRKKLLALDLDNTLWKGVLGEDGREGIRFRPDSYEGRVFWQVLSHIKALAETGIVLAINSKNNEHEVLQLLDDSDFPLSRDDFACIKANWDDKSANLVAISEELGLSLDSMVMLDDSDAECIMLRQTHPEVVVVQVPKRLSEYPSLLASLPYFERPRVTEADTIRKLDYRNTQKRKQLAQTSGSLDEFLKALQIKLTLFLAEAGSFDRLVQLFERTNQFNLSGRRFSRQELENHVAQGGIIVGASYQDSFGSAGIIGAVVAQRDGTTAIIENFVVSCRVLGRLVEHHILYALNRGFFDGALTSLKLVFHETARNVPAQVFFKQIATQSSGIVAVSELVTSPHVTVAMRGREEQEAVSEAKSKGESTQ